MARPEPGVHYARPPAGQAFWELKTCRGMPHARRAHAHREWSLGLVEAGRCTVRCAGARALVQAPALVWFAPGTVHECAPADTGEWSFRMLYWPAPGVLGAWSWHSLGPRDQQDLTGLFDRLDRVAHSPEAETGAPDIPQLLRNLGLELPEATGRGCAAGPEAVTPCAAPSGLARPDRRFKRQTGLPPGQYRLLQQLLDGQELLRRGASPLEAALEAGFYDQSHFTRLFRRLTGTSPRRFQGR